MTEQDMEIKMNGWTFEETVKTAENLMESERNMFKWDVLRHLRDFAELFFEELRQYREIKDRLKAVYGECDGLLETAVDQAVENAVSILEKHEGIDIGDPYKSRLLTDEDVDKWEAYKAIGTPEECRAAMEKQKVNKELESHDEKHILKYCIGLMQEMVDEFAEWYKWIHGEDAISEIDEEERFCVRKSYFRIVQKLFLFGTRHSGGTSTRAKCKQLGVDSSAEIIFDWSEEE